MSMLGITACGKIESGGDPGNDSFWLVYFPDGEGGFLNCPVKMQTNLPMRRTTKKYCRDLPYKNKLLQINRKE